MQPLSTVSLLERDSLLDVHELCVSVRTPQGHFDILSDVSVDVRPGEIVGVVGESGSGKSTLARAIIGLLPDGFSVSSQRMTYAGRDLATLRESEWCKIRGGEIGMIFQDPGSHLDPVIRVGKQIEESIRLHRKSAADADQSALRLLERAGIRDPQRVARAYPFQLSGGLQQRAMIAIALAGQPRLLLADEPTSSLDVIVQRGILELLRAVADSGIGILLVTHDLAIVSEMCDRAYVLYAGYLMEHAPSDRLIQAPLHPYTQAMLAANLDRPGKEPVPIPGAVPRLSEPPGGCAFHPRCGLAGEECAREVPLLQRAGERGVACWKTQVRP